MKTLWSMCSFTDDNDSTTDAAFSALSKFNRTHFKCSYLPELFQERLKDRNKKLMSKEENKDRSIDELFVQVPASCYLDMFGYLLPSAYKGFKQFLTAALTDEIDSIPRRLQNNREKIYTEDDQQTIQKNFYDLVRTYLSNETTLSLADLEKSRSASSFVLYCYEIMPNKNSSGKAMKVSPEASWTAYEKTLRLLLAKCSFQLDGNSLNKLAKGWECFLQKAFDSCVQVSFEYILSY